MKKKSLLFFSILAVISTSFSTTITIVLAPKYLQFPEQQPQAPLIKNELSHQIQISPAPIASEPATLELSINQKNDPSPSPSPLPTIKPSPSPTPTPKLIDTDPLSTTIATYFKLQSSDNITINDQTTTHAQGQLGQKWWLAVNSKANGWKIVATGSSYVNCADITGYNFPTAMVPTCWDYATNQLINR